MLYPSRLKQSGGTGGTDVYIDGVKSSASRVDIESFIETPTSMKLIINDGELYGCGTNNIYEFVNDEFVSIGDMPSNYEIIGNVLSYNNEIHIIYGKASDDSYHYKWNGTTWVVVSTLPYNIYAGQAVVYSNEIHILGGLTGQTSHYKWNGTSWVSVSTLPINVYSISHAIVYNNEIHLLGGYGSGYQKKHYKWNGSTWSEDIELPVNANISTALVVCDNKIHMIQTGHYEFNGTSWTTDSQFLIPCNYSAVEYEQEILYNASGVLGVIGADLMMVSVVS